MTEETEVVEPAPEQEQSQVVSQEPVQEQPKIDFQAENWKKANEILAFQKKEIEELKLRLQAQEAAKAPVKEEVDEFASLDPEDYLTVSNARKMAEKLAERKAQETVKQEMEKFVQQQTIASDEQRVRTKYDDYDYVIENFAIPLIKNDPALAHAIQTSKNPAETAYRLGKLSDSYEETNMPKQTSPKAEKIMKNNSRPVSSAAMGSPLKSQAENFSKMSPQQIWEESQKYARKA